MITVKDLSNAKDEKNPELTEMLKEMSDGRDPAEVEEKSKEGEKHGVQ